MHRETKIVIFRKRKTVIDKNCRIKRQRSVISYCLCSFYPEEKLDSKRIDSSNALGIDVALVHVIHRKLA